jgi:two-component system CheB/CheR fusion protein
MSEDLPGPSADPPSAEPSERSPGEGAGAPDERERRARVILDEMSQFVALLDARGNILEVNRPALEGAGYQLEQIRGRPFWELGTWQASPGTPGRVEQAVRDAAEGRFVRFEVEHLGAKAGGAAITTDFSLKPVTDAEGGVAYLLAEGRDITEKVRAEAELARKALELQAMDERLREFDLLIADQRRSEEARRFNNDLLRAVVDGLTDSVFVKDARGRYLLINAAGAALLGRTVDDVLGKHDAELFTPETGRRLEEDDRRVMAEGRARTFEEEVTAAGVTRTLLSTRAPYRDQNGRVVGVIGIARDITLRKQSEEDLRRAKEAAEAGLRAKNDFLAVLSHELRTPLTPVLATATSLETRPDLAPDLRDDIGLIRRNIELEARLIDDLLDLAEVMRGGIRLHHDVIDAHACLRAALEPCQSVIRSKRLEVSFGLWADRHHVDADPVRLRQVFWNLLDNAVKFTPEGGRIALRTDNDAAGRLTVEVADTGVGIAPAALPRVFDAFEQSERIVRRGHGGLGLGLSLSRRLVELHGGTLTAASEGRGRGASFTVVLPTARAAPAAAAPPPALAEMPRTGLAILLVEDHEDTLLVLARLLRSLGHTVSTARTVGEALGLASRNRFDLLVSDIGLPDGSGLDVMRQVKDRYGLRGIALSGFGRDADIERSREAGFDDHLIKPVDFQALKEKIGSVRR